ncbi:MAG: CAAX protease, partial [Caldilineaceae bacterium]
MTAVLVDVLVVLALLVVAIFVWLALSPFETLGWWAGWFGDRIYWESPPDESEISESGPRNAYVIFYSGVGRATGETLSYRERDFLRRLATANPDAQVIDDIFPYAVNNLSLTSQPWLSRIWRLSLTSKRLGVPLLGMLINVRNIMQIMTSADRRYGPIFNQGVAEVTVNGLIRHGYTPERSAPILLIGYSGAGQIAVGSALYIKEWTRAPVYVISLAGVFASDPAMLRIDHLYHLVGSKDTVEPWWFMAPGRWSAFAT